MPIYTYKIYNEENNPTEMTFEDYFEVGEAPETIEFDDGSYAKRFTRPFGLQKFSSSFDTEFPYFDRGLGETITSAKHREDLCKKKGVIPVDGDIDHSEEMAELQRSIREDDAILADMKDRLENHPGYSEYRRMRDSGWKPKRIIKERGTINHKGA